MDIHFISQNDLDFLKENVSYNLENYKNDNNDWIEKELGHNPFIIFKKPIEDFKLKPEGKEIENAKILYSAMKGISDSEATDERIWVGLSHRYCWDFMRKNLEFSIEKSPRIKFNKSTVLNRYFHNTAKESRKRSIYINNLSKLWWAGRLCYNENDPEEEFKYLKLFESAFSHKLINTFSSNYMANKTIRFSVFEAGLHLMNKGVEIKGDTLIPLTTYLNELGGKVLLDLYSFEELKNVLIKFADENLDKITDK